MDMNDDTSTFDNSSFRSVGNKWGLDELAIHASIFHTDNDTKGAILKHFFGIAEGNNPMSILNELTERQCADVFVINTLFAIMDSRGESLRDIQKKIEIPAKYFSCFHTAIKALDGTPTPQDLDDMYEME